MIVTIQTEYFAVKMGLSPSASRGDLTAEGDRSKFSVNVGDAQRPHLPKIGPVPDHDLAVPEGGREITVEVDTSVPLG